MNDGLEGIWSGEIIDLMEGNSSALVCRDRGKLISQTNAISSLN
jgi:hypothetical protein